MARRARVAAYDRRKGSRSIRDSASATGSASSLISKMRSRLSIKGTHAAVSPRSASFFNAATSEYSRAWCEGRDTPWYQEVALS
jgi:hypothetical protein